MTVRVDESAIAGITADVTVTGGKVVFVRGQDPSAA